MRWIFRLIGAVVVMAAVTVGAVLFLPSERIAQIAADRLSDATGRAVTLSGETTLSLHPVLGVSTGAAEVANADWSDAGPMLRADSLKIGVAPLPLLRGEIRITGLEIVGPQIRLERAADGRAGAAPQAQGRLDLDLADTRAFLAALGMRAAPMPEDFGRRLKGGADVTLTEARQVSLRDLALDLGGNAISGTVDVDLSGDLPRIDAQLDAGALDLSQLAGAGDGGGPGNGGGGDGGWSRAPIDASALSLANGVVALSADSIDLGDLTLDATRLRITLDRSRAVVGLQEVRAYRGRVTGEFVANNRSGLSVGGDLTAQDVDLERVLTDAMGLTRFAATGGGNVQFLGVGQSVHEIMNSLSGEGRIGTGRGVISGIDLDRMMRSGDVTGGTTVFDEVSASFTMEDGNLYNRDLAVRLPLARAEGEGRIGLGARDIDYLFTPVLLAGETSRGLAIPVRIRGAWADPRITPDLERALDLNLRQERQELEDKTERRLERELRERLDLDAQEGQSLEGAIRDQVEDRALESLRNLFD